jgi:hypothetical protein
MSSIVFNAVAGKTTTTGTGTYAITANVAGNREFSQLNDGDICVCVIRNATNLEIGRYTKGGGASPTLARTQIFCNLSGTTSAVNWTGGEKDIRSTLATEMLPALIVANIWSAAQSFRQNKLYLDSDDQSWIVSDVDDQIAAFLNNIEFLRLINGTPPALRIQWTDAGTATGPTLTIDRNSASPAINDKLGQLVFQGRDSAGNNQIYGKMQCSIMTQTSTAEDGILTFEVPKAGVDSPILKLSPDDVSVMPGVNDSTRVLMIGKTTTGVATVGVECRSDGLISATTDNIACVNLNRKNGDGTLVNLHRDGVVKGVISVSGETVSYQAFVGAHPSSIVSDDKLKLGSVLVTTDEIYDETRPYLPQVRLSQHRCDKRVYGVYGGINEDGSIIVNALGAWQVLVSGPVIGGDLLCCSDVPGVAEVQKDDIVRSCTIGKVTRSDFNPGIRLVPATLCCG